MQPYKRPRLAWTFLAGIDVEPKAPIVRMSQRDVIVEHRKSGKRPRLSVIRVSRNGGSR